MAAAYSLDLRERVLKAFGVSGDANAAAATFGVSRAWVHRLAQRHWETQSITPRKQTKFRSRVLAGQEERLKTLVTAKPDATLAELRAQLPTTAALSTLWLELDRLGFTFKKTVHADEQRRPAIATARRRWTEPMPLHNAAQYVFVDESGVTTDLLRRYARSPCGLRISDHTPCSHWQTHTVVAALRSTALTATAVFDGRSMARRSCVSCRRTVRTSTRSNSRSRNSTPFSARRVRGRSTTCAG